MNIQHHTFESGGFVLHKVMINGQKYSAWFDKAGKLVDAERTTKFGHAFHVPERAVNVRAALAKVGQRYVPRASV